MDISQVLISQVVTEKSIAGQKMNKYIFLVRKGTNKVEIKQTVEHLYGVKVLDVNLIKIPRKEKLVRRGVTAKKRPAGIKAIVTLKSGTIDFSKIHNQK